MSGIHFNEFTVFSIPLTMTRAANSCAGTGFLYLHKSAHYLVTAWHNVSGRNFIDKQPISKAGWLPSHLKCRLPLKYASASSDLHQFGHFDFQTRLYSDDDESQPIWLVHRQHGSRLDIAAIPLAVLTSAPLVQNPADREGLDEVLFTLNGANEPRPLPCQNRDAQLCAHSAPDFLNKLEIAQELYVIGFPEAIVAGEGTAIWKRGSIASEPELPINGRPCFLIDSATRPGLSGAPVVGKFSNPSWDNNGKGVLTLMGSRLGFCGLYTSRLGKNVEGAQLGVVWTRDAIQQVIDDGVIGKSSVDIAGLMEEGLNDPIV